MAGASSWKSLLAGSAAAFVMAAGAAAGVDAAGWKAGVAQTRITPEKPMWLAGYGRRDHEMEGVRQHVWAKALALEDRNGRVGVIVTLDLCAIDRAFCAAIQARLAEKYGIRRDQLILNCSHTHSGPVVGMSLRSMYPLSPADEAKVRAYTAWLEGKVADVVGEALSSRIPATVSTGNGICRFAVNRRRNREGLLASTTELVGSRDYAVPVLKVEDAGGKAKAILFGYACHNTVLDEYLVCGDYAGYAQEEVERFHPGATAMFFQGAGADQNPLPRRKVSLAVQYGRELAAAVEQTLSDGMSVRAPELVTKFEETMLEMEEPMSAERLAKISREDGWRGRSARALAAELASGKASREYPYPVTHWLIGDQKLFALGGEIVSGYAVEIKKRYGGDAFVIGYSNDVMSYIPTPEILDEGGYEAKDSHLCYGRIAPWKRDVMQRILDAVDRLAK